MLAQVGMSDWRCEPSDLQKMEAYPLFEREHRREDSISRQRYQSELYECKRLLEGYARRQNELEFVNEDLERRLEKEATERLAFETKRAEDKERLKSEAEAALKEMEIWKQKAQEEERRREILEERLRRTERELYRMHQRKFDIEKDARKQETERVKLEAKVAKDLEVEQRRLQIKKDHELRAYRHVNPRDLRPEDVRERRALAAAMDFFGFS